MSQRVIQLHMFYRKNKKIIFSGQQPLTLMFNPFMTHKLRNKIMQWVSANKLNKS